MQGVTRSQGIAKKCETEGGIKVDFDIYILDLWKKIGYAPDNFDLSEVKDCEDENDTIGQQTGGTVSRVILA